MSKKKLVVLTGAGISAESGLKTFRDSDGLWQGYDISEVATPEAWRKNRALVLEFYNMRRKDVLQAAPNEAHFGLARLEKDFDVTVITQNIDNLHELGGSTKVIHLHGEIFSMRSEKNPDLVAKITGDIAEGDTAEDGAQYRPDIVWFGEAVPMMETAVPIVNTADVFVVIGTSLLVYPAAGLINYTNAGIPIFVIDRKLPDMPAIPSLMTIEKPATQGILELEAYLARLK
ncbi:MAG: NAD-dependent deacylase [Chitinophagaceae bacterium]|nr:MAG: NAD-dependent deacylase [Chitinophagaceae bacterium]